MSEDNFIFFKSLSLARGMSWENSKVKLFLSNVQSQIYLYLKYFSDYVKQCEVIIFTKKYQGKNNKRKEQNKQKQNRFSSVNLLIWFE